MDTTYEVWKPVYGWEDFYEVSDQGRVRSFDRVVHQRNGRQRRQPARFLKVVTGASGHHYVAFVKNHKTKLSPIHAVVLEAFVGPRPPGMYGCHYNDIKTDNRLENLRWDTPLNNSLDAVRNGSLRRGKRGPQVRQRNIESLPGEEWKPVVGYERSYEVSSFGRVKSLERAVTQIRNEGPRTRTQAAFIKSPTKVRGGYLNVNLCKDGVNTPVPLHRVVLTAFVGPRPDGMFGCHGDGNPANNRLDNLRWDTRENNALDTIKHGTHSMAGKTHCKHGHEFTPDNTHVSPGTGWRTCKACRVMRSQARPKSPRGHMRDRTHCPRGHEYTPENTRIYQTARKRSRSCIACEKERYLRTRVLKRPAKT